MLEMPPSVVTLQDKTEFVKMVSNEFPENTQIAVVISAAHSKFFIHHGNDGFIEDYAHRIESLLNYKYGFPWVPETFKYTLAGRKVETKRPLFRVEFTLDDDPTKATQVVYITRSEYQAMLDRCNPITFLGATPVKEDK